MNRKLLTVALSGFAGLAGCNPPSPPANGSTPAPIVTVVSAEVSRTTEPTNLSVSPDGPPATKAPTTDTPPVPAPAPVPASQPPAPFAMPDDLGGKVLIRVLTVSLPASPVLPRTTAPTVRDSAIDRAELPLPAVAVAVPMAPLPSAKLPKLSPPLERVPGDVGQPDAGLIAAKFADRPQPPKSPTPPTPTAADVPRLAQQTPERASLDDPTTEISTASVIFTNLPFPEMTLWLAKVGVPDPFEFVNQLRGKLPTEMELGGAPVIVVPAKP